jgi:hypothetical protein
MLNGLARGRRTATSCPPAQRDVVPATIQPDRAPGGPALAAPHPTGALTGAAVYVYVRHAMRCQHKVNTY